MNNVCARHPFGETHVIRRIFRFYTNIFPEIRISSDRVISSIRLPEISRISFTSESYTGEIFYVNPCVTKGSATHPDGSELDTYFFLIPTRMRQRSYHAWIRAHKFIYFSLVIGLMRSNCSASLSKKKDSKNLSNKVKLSGHQ